VSSWLVYVAVFFLVSTAPQWLPSILHTINPFQRWAPFTSDEGRFSVDFPARPKRQTMRGRTGDAPPQDVVFFISSPSRDAAFLVGFADEFEDVLRDFSKDQILDSARDGAVTMSKGRLDGELFITKDSYPGRDLHISGPGSAASRFQIFLVGHRRYMVGVTATTAAGIFSRDVGRFFDSFRLTAESTR